jgi:hypothetical protein
MHVEVNGTRLWFDVDGPAPVPDGSRTRQRPTVVLVHGGPGSYDHFGTFACTAVRRFCVTEDFSKHAGVRPLTSAVKSGVSEVLRQTGVDRFDRHASTPEISHCMSAAVATEIFGGNRQPSPGSFTATPFLNRVTLRRARCSRYQDQRAVPSGQVSLDVHCDQGRRRTTLRTWLLDHRQYDGSSAV